MKICYLFLILLILEIQANGQTAAAAIDNSPRSIQERFQLMKGNSQTFQEYKVIKETILDGVWKISTDTIKKLTNRVKLSNNELIASQAELSRIQNELKLKEASIVDITFDSTHLSILGIQMTKGFSKLLFFSIVAGLISIILFGLFRMKLMITEVRESNLIVNNLTHDFDDFKKSALDKQAKLSRELQTERNKNLELKGAR